MCARTVPLPNLPPQRLFAHSSGAGAGWSLYNRSIVTLDFLGNLQRTQMCGELRATNDGDQVVLMGWVNRRRDHGNLIFLDLRDRSGITQIVLDKDLTPEGHAKAEQGRPEYVVAVVGNVRLRAQDVVNPKMATGAIEVKAKELL